MKNIFAKFFKFGNFKVENIEEKPKYDEPADFETAITAVGFGKFNIFVILLTIPMCWSGIFETTVMSFVFPNAQCDLDLSLEDKGMINAVTYAGTISSAFVWGYLFDTLGRKKLLIIGFFLNGVVDILCSLSQNLTFLMVMKFMGGFITNGPFAALTSYISEIHSAEYRSRVPILFGFWNAIGTLYLPLLASFILPMKFKLIIAESFVFYPWGLYILLNSIPPILSGMFFFMLPESPKFLMTMGRNEEALQVFRRIYSINTGELPETYPVKALVEEVKAEKTDEASKSTWKDGCAQMRPLFCLPYLKILVLSCALQTFLTMSLNTLRLWLPQLFQAINDYKFAHNGTSSSLCEMITIIQPKDENDECFVNTQNLEVYINSMIVAATTASLYVIAGSVVNLLGQKNLLTIVSLLGGLFAAGIYFAPNSAVAVVFLTGFTSFTGIGTNVILVVVVNLFPTSLRTMTVSLVMMCGRGAAMFGNIVFPYLLELGCGPPFIGIACCVFSCFLLTLRLPKENKNFI